MSNNQIQNIKRSIMGTIEFDLAAKGHRGFQNFLCYPATGEAESIQIQSDKRIGRYYPETGFIQLSKSHSGGAYFHHFQVDRMMNRLTDLILSETDRKALNAAIKGTAGIVGNTIMHVDNTAAAKI